MANISDDNLWQLGAKREPEPDPLVPCVTLKGVVVGLRADDGEKKVLFSDIRFVTRIPGCPADYIGSGLITVEYPLELGEKVEIMVYRGEHE